MYLPLRYYFFVGREGTQLQVERTSQAQVCGGGHLRRHHQPSSESF